MWDIHETSKIQAPTFWVRQTFWVSLEGLLIHFWSPRQRCFSCSSALLIGCVEWVSSLKMNQVPSCQQRGQVVWGALERMERMSCSQDTSLGGAGWHMKFSLWHHSGRPGSPAAPLPLAPRPQKDRGHSGVSARGPAVFWVIHISASVTAHKNHLGILVSYQVLKAWGGSHMMLIRPRWVVRL